MNFGEIDQILLFGGGQLLSELASKLVDTGFKVLVVTSERHSTESLVEPSNTTLQDLLTQKNIAFVVSKDVNEDINVIERIAERTLGISVGAAWIFKPDFISLFKGRLVNIHGARLPQDRGGGGFSWRILRDDRLGFSLIHQIDPGVDTGDIVKYEEYFFPMSCRLPIDYKIYSMERYRPFLDEFILEIKAGKIFDTIAQPEYLSTYWPRLNSEIHAYLDWSWALKDIEQFICAFDDPYPGAITYVSENKVRLKKCLPTNGDGTFHAFQTGIIYKITGGAIFVATREGSLIVRSVQDEGDSDVKDALNVGDRFYTPIEYLEQAKRFRAVYTPKGLKGSPGQETEERIETRQDG